MHRKIFVGKEWFKSLKVKINDRISLVASLRGGPETCLYMKAPYLFSSEESFSAIHCIFSF